MKNSLKVLCLVVLATFFAGCPKDDAVAIQPPKPFAEQLPIDAAAIDDFLATHFVTVDAEYNTTFTLIEPGGTQTPIKDMPNLKSKDVFRNDLTYTLYYLELNPGDINGESPIKVDSSFVSYEGMLLNKTVFDAAESPVWFRLDEVIAGWGEIIPEFRAGTTSENPDGSGSVIYENFGAGVMFLPSAFAYYNSSVGATIPAYSPLIFSFKLISQKHRDHDNDRVLSVFEYYDANGNVLDTDGDGVPNYLDIDDDGDGFLTKQEIRFTYLDGTITKTEYYPFNGASIDNPLTPFDETKGIPSCSGDFTTPTRIRKHLDPNCN